MIKIEYKCDKCGRCEPHMPSKVGGVIICYNCNHEEKIPMPKKREESVEIKRSYEERIKEFVSELQKLSNETGIYIEEFGDQFYNPSLEFYEEDATEFYSLSLKDGDIFSDSRTYIVRKGNGYDGEML